MATLINKNQLDSGVYTNDNLVAGNGIEMVRQQFLIANQVSNFSTSNYIKLENLDFSLANSWEIITHFKNASSASTGAQGLFSGISNESDKKSFDILVDNNNSATSTALTGQGVSGWYGYPTVSGISLNTEYYSKAQFNGTSYIYTVATDKNFTQIFSTKTFEGSAKVKNNDGTFFVGLLRRPLGDATRYFTGSIYMKDLKVTIDTDVVFDGETAKAGIDYTIVGNPTIVYESYSPNKYYINNKYATSTTVGGVRISIDANNVVTIYTGD